MDMSGEQRIPAAQATVWQALNDPEILKACIPGCQDLVKETDTRMSARLLLKVGPVSARFEGSVVLSDLDPPNSYRITGEGQGGMAGFAKGEARVRLRSDGGETILSYEVTAQVGGRLAQLGARLIDVTAKQMSAAFFKRFAEEIAAQSNGGPREAADESGAEKPEGQIPLTRPPHSRPRPSSAPSRNKGMHWLAGLVVLSATLIAIPYLYGGGVAGGMSGCGPFSAEFIAALVLILTAAMGYLGGRLAALERDR